MLRGRGKARWWIGWRLTTAPQQETVGIVAVDPTSPFTGGAILGDRIRMQSHHANPGLYGWSMATRGFLGGLASTTADIASVVEASGKTRLLIETVGVGQDEVDIVRLADVTVVVLVPGLGDDVQSIKAGILEIADIFVVNKSDREGADRVEREIRAMQSLGGHGEGSGSPVVRTVATTGEGTAALAEGPAFFAGFFTDFLAAFLAGVFLAAAPLAAFFAGDFLAAFLLAAFFAAFFAGAFFAAFLAGTFLRTSPTVVAAVPIAVLMALAKSDATASPIPTVAPAFSTIVLSAICSLPSFVFIRSHEL